MDSRPYRLPRNVWPKRYAIDLDAHPLRAAFSGRVQIDLDVRATTNRIEIHARELTLVDPELSQNGQPIPALIKPSDHAEVVVFETEGPLEVGAARLDVAFRGRPNASMHGLYVAQDGKDRAVCTQCEATDARAIFPCFDEPEFKAEFEWKIRTGREVTALANGALVRCETAGSQRTWLFEATPPISSYLVAFVVGDFESTDASEVNGVTLRVFGLRGKKAQASFAHAFTERLIPWYETYFDVPYPYGKYDQVAVPGFDAGAMENVGLVLFRQNLLLMDPKSASWHQEKLIAKVIAHELAHMWFGNLVTMKWWDDLWLNEAFAEWFAHKATHAMEPNYEVWNDFQSDKNRALSDDALPTTHAIWAPVETPSQALEMFDVITYQKGCAVMRMLESFVGDDAFRRGIRTYMKAFSGANASGSDLWAHLGKASEQPVGELMRSWIEQPGFPVVSYDLVSDTPSATTVRFKQKRFFSNPKTAASPNAQTWNVPIVLRFEDDEGEKRHAFILDAEEGQTTLVTQGAIRWCYANASEIGFYRQDPSPTQRHQIVAHGVRALAPVEQVGFIEDQWSLVRNATSNITAFFSVLEGFVASEDHNVLRSVAERLGTLRLMLEDSGHKEALNALQRRIDAWFRPHAQRLGLGPNASPDETQNQRQGRAITMHALGAMAEAKDVIDACARFAAQERIDPTAVDPNIASVVLAVSARFGDGPLYDAWYATYNARVASGGPPQDALRYLHTFSAFRGEALVERTLALIEDGTVPQESIGGVLGQLLGARHSQGPTWAHLKHRWSTLSNRVGDMGVSRVVESLGALKPSQRQELEDFFVTHPPRGAERALLRALEKIDQMGELADRVTPELIALLVSN